MIKCFVASILVLLSVSSLAETNAPKSKSFEYYAQGKVLESIIALKQELKTQKFNALVLNSQYKRLLSAYRSHIGVSDQDAIELLKLIQAQPASKDMEFNVSALLKEFETLPASKPSVKQMKTYLDSNIERGQDTSIISNDPLRLAKINMTRLYSSRQIKVSKGEERAEWTFLAGKAGFYHFNTGNAELKLYVQMCERLGAVSACSEVKNAKSMLKLGESI